MIKEKRLQIKDILFLGLLLALILQLLIINHKSVFAQEFATGINPPILFIEAEAPANIKAPITIENQSDQSITYDIFLRPFKANASGTGVPNYDPELRSIYKPFFDNVQIRSGGEDITEISLSPKQKKDLELNIFIDADTPPMDRYFTVVFLDQGNDDESEASTTGAKGGIGTNVLLSIGPKDEPEGRISKLNVPKFVSRGPVPIELEIANRNEYYVVSEGNIVIENIFGHAVGSLEFGPLSILRLSNRLVIDEKNTDDKLYWNEKYPIGIYKVKANVALSEKGPLLTEETTFYAFPVEIVLVLILIILIIIWLIRRAREKANEND